MTHARVSSQGSVPVHDEGLHSAVIPWNIKFRKVQNRKMKSLIYLNSPPQGKTRYFSLHNLQTILQIRMPRSFKVKTRRRRMKLPATRDLLPSFWKHLAEIGKVDLQLYQSLAHSLPRLDLLDLEAGELALTPAVNSHENIQRLQPSEEDLSGMEHEKFPFVDINNVDS